MHATTRRLARSRDGFKIVLVRHGESAWNASERFSGWVDVDLTKKGIEQARQAGYCLKAAKFEFDEAHTSFLKRSTRTLHTILHTCGFHHIPVRNTWRLNERHYGALTGLSKVEAREAVGPDVLLQFRRGFDCVPPPMTYTHPMYQHVYANTKYDHITQALMPFGESLRMCMERVTPYFDDIILESAKSGKRILVSAHNNVIRCLVMHLDGVLEEDLVNLEIPCGVPLVYEFTNEGEVVGDADDMGFRGKFLEPATEDLEAARVDPTQQHIDVSHLTNFLSRNHKKVFVTSR